MSATRSSSLPMPSRPSAGDHGAPLYPTSRYRGKTSRPPRGSSTGVGVGEGLGDGPADVVGVELDVADGLGGGAAAEAGAPPDLPRVTSRPAPTATPASTPMAAARRGTADSLRMSPSRRRHAGGAPARHRSPSLDAEAAGFE